MASPGTASFTLPRSTIRTAAACAVVLFGSLFLPQHSASQSASDPALIAQIDAAVRHRETDLAGYTVEEHYTINNSHFNDPAIAVVKVTYTRDSGKHYEVVSRTGPSLLATRLLNSMLAEEQTLSVDPSRSSSVVTSANYTMSYTGSEDMDGRHCEVLTITPKVKTPYVMDGRIWVDARSKLMVRMEGITPKSPSFLAGKPAIARDYGEQSGYSLATHSHATSSGLFTGKTVIDIDYVHYRLTP
jgi:negative regulator of sigma E activity